MRAGEARSSGGSGRTYSSPSDDPESATRGPDQAVRATKKDLLGSSSPTSLPSRCRPPNAHPDDHLYLTIISTILAISRPGVSAICMPRYPSTCNQDSTSCSQSLALELGTLYAIKALSTALGSSKSKTAILRCAELTASIVAGRPSDFNLHRRPLREPRYRPGRGPGSAHAHRACPRRCSPLRGSPGAAPRRTRR
jgi:hypothetical protein